MIKSWSNILPERLRHFLEFERPCFPPPVPVSIVRPPLSYRRFRPFIRKPRDPQGIFFFAQLGGKERKKERERERHAREPRSLIPGEIKPRRSKRGLHNGWRPNFQFRGQKESSTLKIEIDQSCRAAVYFFFFIVFLSPFLSLSLSLYFAHCPSIRWSRLSMNLRSRIYPRTNFPSMISRQVLRSQNSI